MEPWKAAKAYARCAPKVRQRSLVSWVRAAATWAALHIKAAFQRYASLTPAFSHWVSITGSACCAQAEVIGGILVAQVVACHDLTKANRGLYVHTDESFLTRMTCRNSPRVRS
jgi:hypothetical protein